MESDNIEKLLEKYFEATTSEVEEKELREYFSQDEVAPHLKTYQPMFACFSRAREEKFTKDVSLRSRPDYTRWLSVAALVVVVLGIYFGNGYREQKRMEQQKAQYAYYQTRKALSLLAQNLDRGTDKVAYLNEFEAAKQKIYKNN